MDGKAEQVIGADIDCETLIICTGGSTATLAESKSEVSTNPANSNHKMRDLLIDKGLKELQPCRFQYQPFGILHENMSGFGKAIPESIMRFPFEIHAAGGRVIKARDEKLTGWSFINGCRQWISRGTRLMLAME